MSKVNLVFFNFDDSIALIRDLREFYKGSSKFDVESMNNAAEVNQYLATTGNGIFFFKVMNKKDLQDAVSILKSQKKLIKKGLVKPACITSLRNKKIESVLGKYGCMDLLEPETRAKTITFKLDFWSKPIVSHLDKLSRAEDMQMRQQSTANNSNKEKEKENFVLVKPLELQSDIWLVKAKSDYKKILRRWLIRLLGPSPYIGSWVEIESRPGTWRYALKNANDDTYIVDDGHWYFVGNKPEFDWKINRWSFPSETPHLYFQANDGTIYSRFKFENGQVKICENSQFALMREEMILETCDSKFNIEGDAIEGSSAENLEGDSNTDNLSNLKGKGAAAEEINGDLKGKGGAADSYGDDPLSGKSSTDKMGENSLSGKGGAADSYGDDPLGGKSSTDKMGENPLAGKSSTDKMGENPLSGKGSAADSYGDDPLGGKSSTDKMGENPLSGKGSAADSYGDDPLGGKSSTDKMGENPLAGKSSTDKTGENPLSGKGSAADSFGDDPLGGKSSTDKMGENPLGGKSSTDRMGENPLSGEGSSADSFGENPLGGAVKSSNKDGDESGKQNDFKEAALKKHYDGKASEADHYGDNALSGKTGTDDLGGPLGGKSSTDKMGEDPLSGKTRTDDLGGPLGKNNDQNANDNGLNGKSGADASGGPLSGKTSTDKMGENPLGGKTKTDDLGGPLSGKNSANHRKNTDPRKNKFQEEALKKHYSGKVGADGKVIPPKIDENGNPVLDPEALPKDELGNPIIDPSLLPVDENGVPLIDLSQLPKDINGNPIIDPEQLPKDADGNIILDPQALEGFEEEGHDDVTGYHVMDGFGAQDEEKVPEQEDLYAKVIDNKAKVEKVDNTDSMSFDKFGEGSENNLSNDPLDYTKKEGSNESALGEDDTGYLEDLKRKKNSAQAGMSDDDTGYLEDLKKKKAELLANADLSAEEIAQELNNFKAQKEAQRQQAASQSDDVGDYFNDKKRKQAAEKSRAAAIASEMDDALGGDLTKDAKGIQKADDNINDGGPGLGQLIGRANDDIDDDGPGLDTIISGTPKDLNLESGELKVIIEQKTDVGNTITFMCDFEDFYEDELIVQAPKNSLAQGSDVSASVSLVYNGQKVKLGLEGNIEEIENYNERKDTLVVSIKQMDPKQFEAFMTLYGDRQSSINDFMERAKGY